MRKMAAAMAVMALVALTERVLAHEDHEHKIMGKVVSIDDKTIEVEAADGKKVTGALSAQTRYLRDKTAAARADVKVGERVVIVVVEDKNMVQNVKQVLLGAAPSAEQKH